MKRYPKRKRSIWSKKIVIGHILSLVLIYFCSVKLANIVFSLNTAAEPEETFFFLENLEEYPFLFWLNCLPILLLILLFYFITNNTLFSICLWGGIFYSLAFANSMKIQMRQDPVMPSDITLIRELVGIIQGFDDATLEEIKSVLYLFLFLLLLTLVLFKNKKMNRKIRIVGIIGVIIGGFAVNHTWYDNEREYNKYPVLGNIYFSVNQYHSKGFVYCFFHNLNTMTIKKPSGYTALQYAQIEKPPAVTKKQIKNLPNIIMIMGEAYSDLSINEHLDFSNYIDPME